MLMYCNNSCARLGNSCVKTLIYVVRTVVHCSISVTFVALLTLTTEFSSVNTTCLSSVVWYKCLGKSLDSSKNSRDWICFTYAAGTSWNNCPYHMGITVVLARRVGGDKCSASLVKGIVSGRLSATGSANLGGSSGSTGPGVLVIAWTAARAALVAISFVDSWTLLATIDCIWANWVTFSKGLSVFFWEGVSTLVDGTSAIVAVSVASLFVHACCCNLAINVFQRPWSGRPFPIVDEVHGSTADYRCLS